MNDWYATHARPEELCAILGERWAICRNTDKNRERYGRCISHKEYRRAEELALERRRVGRKAGSTS